MKPIDEAYRLSETYLSSQLTIALAADTRAIISTGIMLITAVGMVWLSVVINSTAGIFGAAFLLVGSFYALRSAMPVGFYVPGSKFNAFATDIADDVSYTTVISEMGKWNDMHIDENNKTLNANAHGIRRAYWFVLIGLLVAIIPHVIIL